MLMAFFESNAKRRDMSSVFNDQNNEIDKIKLANHLKISIYRDLSSNEELANKKYVDDSLEDTIFRLNWTLQNKIKVSVGDTTYNFSKKKKQEDIDTTKIKFPNQGGYLLHQWNIECNGTNINGKWRVFKKSTKTSSPAANRRATHLPLIADSLMYNKATRKKIINSGSEKCFWWIWRNRLYSN